MSGDLTRRSEQAAERRQHRQAQKLQRELERKAKHDAKLSELEKANLEVATYENRLELLLSLHKEQSERFDWMKLAVALPPPLPCKHTRNETKGRLSTLMLSHDRPEMVDRIIQRASEIDEQEFQESLKAHSKANAKWDELRSLAHRILNGESNAYTAALIILNPFTEISELGSSLDFTVHSVKTLECSVKVKGVQAIPDYVKSLTAKGKVSTKPMSRSRFHQLYQDYVCSCLLRIGREVFGILPIDTLLLNACVDVHNPATGHDVEQPVLSVAITRSALTHLNFDRLSPSDVIDTFLHRGDFKASRKSEAFQPIAPLTVGDLPLEQRSEVGIADTFAATRTLKETLRRDLMSLAG